MITLREVVASLYGAWRLCRFDRAAVGFFDATIEGFWRSFFALALVAPFDFSIVLLVRADPWPDDLVHYGLAYVVVYILSWIVWPLVAFYLTRALDRADAFPLYISAHNWAQMPASLLQLVAVILARGFFPEQTLAAAQVTLLVILVYEGFIAAVALRLDRIVAAGVVGAYFAVTYLIALVGVYLMG